MTETVVSEVLSEVRGQVGFITLNRPRALNALSLGMVRDLMGILLAWQNDARVLAVAIRGSNKEGPFGAFCAGGGASRVGIRSFGAQFGTSVQRPAGASGSASVSSSGSSCEAGQSVSRQRPFFRACTIRSPYPQRSRAIPSSSVRMTAAGKTSDALRMPNVTSAPAAGRPSFSRTRTASRRTGA